jgi:hypothetical protein
MSTRTVGASPKLYAAVAAAVLGYLVTQQAVDLPALADLAINVVLVGLAVWRVGPGSVQVIDPSLEKRDLHENAELGL